MQALRKLYANFVRTSANFRKLSAKLGLLKLRKLAKSLRRVGLNFQSFCCMLNYALSSRTRKNKLLDVPLEISPVATNYKCQFALAQRQMPIPCPPKAPAYYTSTLHVVAVISAPINVFGLYLVLYKSPAISKYKYCIFYVQVRKNGILKDISTSDRRLPH